jgi:poly(3-hydroxybutyrate) depolymerase
LRRRCGWIAAPPDGGLVSATTAFVGRRSALYAAALLSVLAAAVVSPAGATSHAASHPWRDPKLDRPAHTRSWVIAYRAHTGRTRLAVVLLPRWYGPRRHPRIPLVISPHGRGTSGHTNSRLWGDLPARGSFAVINPDGEGNNLGAYSWGAPGQIDDLAKLPGVAQRALPWLRIDRSRIYAVGGSMGGQEALLLLARRPRLLAGVAAFDSLVDFAHQYRQYPRLACSAVCRGRLGTSLGRYLQQLARTEVGGDPAQARGAYAARSPLTYARAIASSCVPLQLWWSRRDRIVVDPDRQSRQLLATLRRLNRAAPVLGIEGTWVHTAEMRASARLPFALARLGLLPPAFDGRWGTAGARVTETAGPTCAGT